MNTQFLKEHEIRVERLDDIPLLISLQQQLKLSELIDSAIPRHWHHQGLSIGQLVIGWNAYILSQGDHRKVAVEDWAVEHQSILSQLLGHPLRRTDFTDDRLSQLLTHFSQDEAWETIETGLWANSVSVYRLTPQRVRLDATRLSGYHTPNSDSLMQHGYNRQTPHLAQVKLMAASIDCDTSGHLLATDVISGDQADDGLYLPIYRRIRETFLERGLLYIGDSKMSALEIRGEIAHGGDFYLMPLAKVGDTAKHFDEWVNQLVEGSQQATLIYNTDSQSEDAQLIAAGYQTTRCQQAKLSSGETYTFDERILVVRSLSEAKKQYAALEQKLAKTTEALFALTPEPKQGRRQIRNKAELIEKAEAILAENQVSDYLRYAFVKQQSVNDGYVGPGRGGANRKKRQTRTTRYQMTQVHRNDAAISIAYQRMGFVVYATNQPQTDLPLDRAVVLYRAAPRIERNFHLFKDAPIGIEPMYVRNDDQIKGLARLLSLCVRLITLIEIVIRRHLLQHNETLSGLYEGNPNRKTDTPTAKKLLHVFRGISRVQSIAPNRHSPYTTPLTPLQLKILSLLGINPTIYQTPTAFSNRLETFGEKCGQLLAHLSHTVNRIRNRDENP